MASSSSSSKRPYTPGLGFSGFSSKNTSPKLTQSRLPALGKKPLITPRGSSSTKKPKAGDRNVRTMFKQQANVTPSATRRKPSTAYAKENHSADEGEEGTGSSSGREEGRASGFRRDAFSSSSRQPHLGRKIINPPPSQRCRGPTISFDDDKEPPCEDTEMEGEELRRRRKRVQEGGKGQLDLVPAEDHEGFDDGAVRSKKKLRRQLEFLTQGDLSPNEGDDADAEEDANEESEDEDTMTVDVGRAASEKEEVVVAVAEESSYEPETMEESLDLDSNLPPILAKAFPPVTLPSDKLSASSLSSDDESFQHLLVPASRARPQSKAVVLVPNSDDDDDCAQLAGRTGAGGADDSGFAEMEEDSKEASQLSSTLRSMPEETFYSLHPAPVRHNPSRVDYLYFESPEFETIPDETFSSLYTAHSQKLAPPDEETQDRNNSLVRTASAILMPPPPLPRRSSSSSQIPRKDSAPREETAVAPVQHRPPSLADPQPPIKRRIILVPDAQYPLPHEPLPSLSQSSQLSPAFDDDAVCEETQFPESLPVASTSTLPLDPPRPAPKRDSTAIAWSGLASAWEGQHIEPPQPISPRQTRLSEFFTAPSPREDDNAVIEDSQTPWDGVTLAQASAFALALEATRARGRAVERIVQEVDGEDEIADSDGEEEDDAMVPSSDPEDGPWSPLGSRLAPRPFDFSFASPPPSPTKSSSPTPRQPSMSTPPADHWSCKASDGSLIWIPRLPHGAPIDLSSKNLPEGIDETMLEASYYWVVRRAMEEAALPEGLGELVEQARSWVKAKERRVQAERFRMMGLGKPVRGADETQEE